MRALILAAGRGQRMRPLSDTTPKPLLKAGGRPLMAWHLEKLAAFGVRDVLVNISHLAQCFAPTLGDGSRWGLRLHFIDEGPAPLETAGAMLNALPELGEAPFLAINGDIWTDFDLATLPREPAGLAHLLLVDNPPQHPQGDFALDADGRVREPQAAQEPALTFAGIGIYRPQLITDAAARDGHVAPARFALAPVLRHAMANGAVSGQHHHGAWNDVGTPERLAALDSWLRQRA